MLPMSSGPTGRFWTPKPGDEEKEALAHAKELLSQAPSRRLTSGHLDEADAGKILTPHRSGSSGIWSATVKSVNGGRILVDLRHPDRKRRPASAGILFRQGGEGLFPYRIYLTAAGNTIRLGGRRRPGISCLPGKPFGRGQAFQGWKKIEAGLLDMEKDKGGSPIGYSLQDEFSRAAKNS